LPVHAAQGHGWWYVLRLRVQVAVEQPTRSIAYLSASTNGFTAAQIELATSRRAGRLVTSTSSLGLVRGLVRQTIRQKVFPLSFANYLQRRGVTGGRNTLTVRVDSPAAPRAVAVRVLAGTGIDRTATPPPSLSLRVSWPVRESPRVGKPFTIGWRLTDRSRLAALDVGVEPVFDARDFRTLGPKRAGFARLEGSRHGRFTLLPLRPVRTTVFIRAESPNANSPAAAIRAVVLPPERSAGSADWPVRIAGALLLAAGIAVLTSRRSGRPRSRRSRTRRSRG
jgi:hypothetical protein